MYDMESVSTEVKEQKTNGKEKQNRNIEKLPSGLKDKYGRLLSLDFFRGFTMFMLMGEALWGTFGNDYFNGTIIASLHTQLSHHPWHGLHFWDLIQPFFMFIVGVAMPISFGKRWARGDSWMKTFKHASKRSLTLLALGVGLYCIHNTGGPHAGEGHLSFELWDVLAQLAFTYMIAFLIMRKSWRFQFSVSVGLLILTELLYRLWPVAGFTQPFTPDHNFGAWLDLVVTGYLSGGHWVAANLIPTAAHTIWGVMAGQLLISGKDTKKKIQILAAAGVIGLIVGYGLDPLTPIIKRIATTSFTVVSGGWCLLALMVSFWAVDVKKYQINAARFFAVVGMNPIFIYMFMETGGRSWFDRIIAVFTQGFLGLISIPLPVISIITAAIGLAAMWYMLYFLYKNKIFISI